MAVAIFGRLAGLPDQESSIRRRYADGHSLGMSGRLPDTTAARSWISYAAEEIR